MHFSRTLIGFMLIVIWMTIIAMTVTGKFNACIATICTFTILPIGILLMVIDMK